MANVSGRSPSESPDYLIDGQIPDAQFDEAVASLVRNTLADDGPVSQFDTEGPGAGSDGESSQEPESIIHPPLTAFDLKNDPHDEDYDPLLHQEDEEQSPPPNARRPRVIEDGLARQSDDPPARSSPSKRFAESTSDPRPFKRLRGVVNFGYLELLNEDIEDAAVRATAGLQEDSDSPLSLRNSQIGLTSWTSIEKTHLYDALARAGRSDLPALADKIGSKSVVEIEHYLNLIHKTYLERKKVSRPMARLAEHPAALELSPQCIFALDEAADTISIVQERKEEQREESRWGKDHWDLTLDVARRLEREEAFIGHATRNLAFIQLFYVPKWLTLSSTIFMNSSIPSNNWTSISAQPPSIWTTALKDFHSLAVSVTKRLVQTSLFIAMSRLRTKRILNPEARDVVRREDVAAAISALNLEDQREKFWSTCARRLRLDVFDDEAAASSDDAEPGTGNPNEGEESPLSYDEVEIALAGEDDSFEEGTRQLDGAEDEPADSDVVSEDGASEDSDPAPTAWGDHGMEIREEADELLTYSAADFPRNTRFKEALENRIAVERAQEQYAQDCDEHASHLLERRMWEVLQQPKPIGSPRKALPEPVDRTNLHVDGLFDLGKQWRKDLRYQSEWETISRTDDTKEP